MAKSRLKWLIPLILLIIFIKALMMTGSLSAHALDETNSLLDADPQLDGVSAEADGLNIELTGPASLETEAVAKVKSLDSTRGVTYVVEGAGSVDNENAASETETTEAGAATDSTLAEPGESEEETLSALNEIVALAPIEFEPTSAILLPDSIETLDQAAEVINAADESQRFRIVGHTDTDGDPDQNLSLSRRRASAVREYLISKEVDSSRLEAEGRGETEPKVVERNANDKRMNRRIEWEVL